MTLKRPTKKVSAEAHILPSTVAGRRRQPPLTLQSNPRRRRRNRRLWKWWSPCPCGDSPLALQLVAPAMEDEGSNPFRRMSSRTRKVATKMAAALASTDNRTQAALARLEALENDNTGIETENHLIDDDEASLDDDDEGYIQKKMLKGTKRKTRQAKALENARKAPKTFLELLQDANLESLPSHVPCYLRAAVGPPSSTSRRHFCSVCGFTATYTCVRCGVRFCSHRCQNIHNDTRCQKFVA